MTIVHETRQHELSNHTLAIEIISDIQHRIGRHFSRSEPRERFITYLSGLLSEVQRKNGCSLAEFAREAAPDGMQRLLTTAKWDVEAVRNELLSCAAEWFGDPHSVIVVSQAAFTKRGRHSAGVQQQYNEDSQRVENCQLGLFLGYATPLSTTLIDRELYLPEEWRQDPERRSRAGIPELAFASRSDLAIRMLRRVMDAGMPMSWVTTSELADVGGVLHEWLTGQQVPHIVEVRPAASLCYESGVRLVRATAHELQRQVPARRWQQVRYQQAEWSRLLLRTSQAGDAKVWLVSRQRPGGAPGRPYVASGPATASLAELARAASAARGVKTALARAKDRVGLDHYEARRYEAWYRHVTLALFADALLQAHTRAGTDGQHAQVTVQSAQGVRGRCLQTTSPLAI